MPLIQLLLAWPQLIVYWRAINRCQALHPNSLRTVQPVMTRGEGCSRAEDRFPTNRLPIAALHRCL